LNLDAIIIMGKGGSLLQKFEPAPKPPEREIFMDVTGCTISISNVQEKSR